MISLNGRIRRRHSQRTVTTISRELDDCRSDYRAAKRSSRFQSRRTGIPSMGSGADWHYRTDADYLWMGEVARDIDRNDPVVGQIIDRVVDNEIQSGFTINATTGDAKLDAENEARWNEEARDPKLCDVAGRLTFHDQERLVARDVKVVGDIFAIPVDQPAGAVQLIESHRSRSPSRTTRNIVHGIELDPFRKPLRYYFMRDIIEPSRQQQTRLKDLISIDAEDDEGNPQVYHVLNQKRVSQTRGITALAPLFDIAGMHDDIQYGKLVQQQISSFFVFLRNRQLGFDPVGADEDSFGGESGTDEYGTRVEDLAPGMEIKSLPGETISGWSSGVPNQEFFPHVKMLLTFIGINLGAPLVMVLMDAGETNFSGYRGAIDQARLGFRCNQHVLISRFHTPVYRNRVRTWIDTDMALRRVLARKSKRINPFAHVWQPPAWPYIEPTKDAMADLMREANTLTSPRRRAAERGLEYSTIVAESIADKGMAIEAAIVEAQRINERYGLEGSHAVTWDRLYQPPMPQGATIAFAAAAAEGSADEDERTAGIVPE